MRIVLSRLKLVAAVIVICAASLLFALGRCWRGWKRRRAAGLNDGESYTADYSVVVSPYDLRHEDRKIEEAYSRGQADALAYLHARRSAAATVGASTRTRNRIERDLARLVIALAAEPRALDDGAAPIQTTITNGAEGPE